MRINTKLTYMRFVKTSVSDFYLPHLHKRFTDTFGSSLCVPTIDILIALQVLLARVVEHGLGTMTATLWTQLSSQTIVSLVYELLLWVMKSDYSMMRCWSNVSCVMFTVVSSRSHQWRFYPLPSWVLFGLNLSYKINISLSSQTMICTTLIVATLSNNL